MTRARQFGAMKLRHALETVCAAYTLREGLHCAYVDDLQWLEKFAELPNDIGASLRSLVRELSQPHGAPRTAIATLSDARVAALVEQLIELTLMAEAPADMGIKNQDVE